MTPPQVVDLLLAAPVRCGTTRLLCIDGPAGSGKTTLANAVAAELDATVLHMDDLYAGWSGLEAGVKQASRIAEAVALRRPVTYAPWNWHRSDRDYAIDVAPSPTLIIEGVGSGAGPLRDRASLLVWMDADEDVRQQRALARDGDSFAPHWTMWADQERVHFLRERTRERADLVLETG
ncbi:adenylate kinase [Nocardioides baekrokdamisoli]|uniref:Adenylate kinase n=1 Tax=Nocardioides baekrokdamisoli TaxID=1804624 RepID=A0A3G9J4K3_9ACTN|nr:AAA family ATPase [Nocardioides baekrokdamisoli]BBH18354.1 adenylate kinase [Nocardioides baekrokdamisoli]